MKMPRGIEIVRINTISADTKSVNLELLNQEYVVIVNHDSKGVNIANWQISNNTTDGWYRELYRFPEMLADGRRWWFEPEEMIFIFSGFGRNKFISKSLNNAPQFHFFMNRNSYLWNLPDSVATLWDEETKKISSLAVDLKKNPAILSNKKYL